MYWFRTRGTLQPQTDHAPFRCSAHIASNEKREHSSQVSPNHPSLFIPGFHFWLSSKGRVGMSLLPLVRASLTFCCSTETSHPAKEPPHLLPPSDASRNTSFFLSHCVCTSNCRPATISLAIEALQMLFCWGWGQKHLRLLASGSCRTMIFCLV